MNAPRIDPTISMGHLIQAGVIIGGMIFGYATMISRVEALEVFKADTQVTNREIVAELRELNRTQDWMRGKMEERWGDRGNRGNGQQ